MHLVVREFIKFGTVGAVAFVVDVGLFNALLHVGEQPVLAGKPLTAGIISAVVATVVAWLGNRYWTFRHRRRSQIHREAVLFFVMNVIGIGIAVGCLAVSRYILGFESALADNIAKNGVGLVLGMAFRFTAYRYVVFRGDREGAPGELDAPVLGQQTLAAGPSKPSVPSASHTPSGASYRSSAPASFPPHVIPGTLPD